MTRLHAGPVEGRGHGAAGEPRTGLSNPHETPAPSTDLRRSLRLLMGPVGYVRPTPGADVAVLTIDERFRWVSELNDWTGSCGADCWHRDEIEALACFRGEGR